MIRRRFFGLFGALLAAPLLPVPDDDIQYMMIGDKRVWYSKRQMDEIYKHLWKNKPRRTYAGYRYFNPDSVEEIKPARKSTPIR